MEQAYRRRDRGRGERAPTEWPSTHGSLDYYSTETVGGPLADEAARVPTPIAPEPLRLEPALSVVTVQPQTGGEQVTPRSGAIGEAALITGGADVAAAEQYSRLAASLHDAQVEQGLRTLMVTSALPREGKTLTCVNLALTLGEHYSRRVLLIDADLRRPSVHAALRLQSRSGLGEVLRFGHSTLPLVTVTPRLSVLVGGRPDASPVADLASERMKALIELVRKQFDWVIIDTPPVGLLPDANLIARWADGVLFVIAARSTPYRVIQDAMERVGPSRVIGSVLNKSDRNAFSDDYYAHYYPGTPTSR